MLQCWWTTGHLPSFFVPTQGDLTAQRSPPPEIGHPRQKMLMPGGGGLGATGIDWCSSWEAKEASVRPLLWWIRSPPNRTGSSFESWLCAETDRPIQWTKYIPRLKVPGFTVQFLQFFFGASNLYFQNLYISFNFLSLEVQGTFFQRSCLLLLRDARLLAWTIIA